MKKSMLVVIALLVGLALAPFAAAREVTDVTQTTVQVAETPRRVVTLAPSLGELAADLLGQNMSRIVGVSEYTDYPPALKKVRSVGPYAKVSIEVIAALKPDLVLATVDGNLKDQIQRLREMRIPVVVVDTGSFAGIRESIRLVSRSLGVEDEGQRMITKLEQGLDKFRKKAVARGKSQVKAHRVLLQLGDDPLVVAGGASFLSEILDRLGALNVYRDSKHRYPRPSLEDAVSKNPDVIIILTMGHDLRPYQKIQANWSRFGNVRAVHDKRVEIVNGDTILRPTLRLLDGITLLERAIYGSAP